jgi:NADP-dependent 3-hydroxy acid dehydrogenase YdfG
MSQRTWFITGTSSGFGRCTTEQLLERGPVAGTFRKLEAVDDLKSQCGATRERIEGGAYLAPGDPAKLIRAAD